LALSNDAQGHWTIQFQGTILGYPVAVLVDSGSSASFLVASVANLRTPMASSVKVANGHLLRCTSIILGYQFHLGEHIFQHDPRVLPLESYDLILGMDWLEMHSPMEVHWKSKWLSFPLNGEQVILQGLTAPHDSDVVVQLLAVDVHDSSDMAEELPPEISAILAQFPQVFMVHTSLPPKPACGHAIPLISGATPVNVQAYHYPPSLKDEIERQVNTMLEQGLIQPSKSPFSSPVLLVRKKDGTWRFCVDYRYLNAMTVKSAYPIPIFDQLLDELGSTAWFSILDLCRVSKYQGTQ
jgi:hypothetical protein